MSMDTKDHDNSMNMAANMKEPIQPPDNAIKATSRVDQAAMEALQDVVARYQRGQSGTSHAQARPSKTKAAPDADLFGVGSPAQESAHEEKIKTPTSAPSRVTRNGNAELVLARSQAVTKQRAGRPYLTRTMRTQQELDMFSLSMEIEEQEARDSNNMGFISTAMIYASLPYNRIEGAVFKRRSGNISLTILNDPDIGLPFGKMPRIMTAFLCTEAKRNGPLINLGRSQNEFAQKLGLSSSGGNKGDITRLKDQTKRLFTSHITLTSDDKASHAFKWRNVSMVENGMLLWNPVAEDETKRWAGMLQLTDAFYQECLNHCVPVDLRVLHKLRSPMAIDIYTWLTYRYNTVSKPLYISWMQLKWQFGVQHADDAQGMYNFMAKFREHLRAIHAVWPSAKFTVDSDKVTLYPSLPHILKDVEKLR